MKPALTIAELAEMPAFGVNKIRKIAFSNLAQSAIKGYTLQANNKVIRVEILRPNPMLEDTPIPQFIELERGAGNEQFFKDIENGKYLSSGDLKVDEFKDAFLPLYEAKLNAKFTYGDNVKLNKVIHTGKTAAVINFTSETDGKVDTHNAQWELLDIAEDFGKVVIIPRALFKSYREFMAILAQTLEVDAERFYLKDDPTEVEADGIEVFVSPTDLVYKGSFKVALPWSGDTVRVVDPFAEDDVTPPVEEEPPVVEPPVVELKPEPKPVTYNVRPNKAALKADGSFLSGTNLKSGTAAVVTDGIVELALAPYNAGKTAIGPSSKGVYPAATGEISCLFAITSLVEGGVNVFDKYNVTLAKNGVNVMTLENLNAWTGVGKPDYILTDSTITDATVQNVTRERFLVDGGLITDVADPEVYTLTAAHKETNSTISVEVSVPKLVVVTPPESQEDPTP